VASEATNRRSLLGAEALVGMTSTGGIPPIAALKPAVGLALSAALPILSGAAISEN